MINMHDIKKGAAVLVDGQPYFVHDFKRAGTGQRRPVLHVKLKHVLTGAFTEKTLSEKDVLEEPNLDRVNANYSYRTGDSFVFLDQNTFEPIELPAELVGDRADLLTDELQVRIQRLDGNCVGFEMPPSVTLEIVECAEPTKGGTASRTSSVGKPAKLSSGLEIEVPLFLKKGERIKISTETREYMGKDNE